MSPVGTPADGPDLLRRVALDVEGTRAVDAQIPTCLRIRLMLLTDLLESAFRRRA